MIEQVEGAELPAYLTAMAELLMSLANEAEAQDVRAIALASRDTVEHLFVLIDCLQGPACGALARPGPA